MREHEDEIDWQKERFISMYFCDLKEAKCGTVNCDGEPRYYDQDDRGDFLCEDCIDQCFWEYKNDE